MSRHDHDLTVMAIDFCALQAVVFAMLAEQAKASGDAPAYLIRVRRQLDQSIFCDSAVNLEATLDRMSACIDFTFEQARRSVSLTQSAETRSLVSVKPVVGGFMTPDEMEATDRHIGDYVQRLKEGLKLETGRTLSLGEARSNDLLQFTIAGLQRKLTIEKLRYMA